MLLSATMATRRKELQVKICTGSRKILAKFAMWASGNQRASKWRNKNWCWKNHRPSKSRSLLKERRAKRSHQKIPLLKGRQGRRNSTSTITNGRCRETIKICLNGSLNPRSISPRYYFHNSDLKQSPGLLQQVR